MKKLALAAAISITFAMTASAASVSRSYNYFSIGGSTLEEIESELSRRGPQLGSTGRRHPGATRMEFKTRLGYGEGGGYCRITAANVTVEARVFLPRWQQRQAADNDVRLIWDTLSADIRRHEESHIQIARSHALMMERALRAIPRERDCATVAERAQQISAEILARHDEEQARFDRVEAINFESRMLRLLNYRLEQIESGRIRQD